MAQHDEQQFENFLQNLRALSSLQSSGVISRVFHNEVVIKATCGFLRDKVGYWGDIADYARQVILAAPNDSNLSNAVIDVWKEAIRFGLNVNPNAPGQLNGASAADEAVMQVITTAFPEILSQTAFEQVVMGEDALPPLDHMSHDKFSDAILEMLQLAIEEKSIDRPLVRQAMKRIQAIRSGESLPPVDVSSKGVFKQGNWLHLALAARPPADRVSSAELAP